MLKLENLDLNLLLVLHHVLECGSVRGAAARLHVTSPAVSNALARLRELLGDPLFVRHGRGITATPRARALAEGLKLALDGLRSAVEDADQFDPATSTRCFTIASADNLGSTALPALARSFSQAMPQAALHVLSLDAAVAQDGLASGKVDLLLGLPPDSPGLRSEPAYEERLVCAGYRPLAKHPRKHMSLELFLEHRHIAVVLAGAYTIDWIDTLLAKRGLSRTVALAVPQFATAAACLVGTPYLAMLPERMARQVSGLYDLVLWSAPAPLPPVEIRQTWHERTDSDPGARFLRDLVRRALATPMPRPRRTHGSRRR